MNKGVNVVSITVLVHLFDWFMNCIASQQSANCHYILLIQAFIFIGLIGVSIVVGDPLIAVPLPESSGINSSRGLSLCYEIKGKPDAYFNLISDVCASVNVHYKQDTLAEYLNVIDAVGIVATDNDGVCHNIKVEGPMCQVTVDGDPLETILRSVAGLQVRLLSRRVQISIPNCAPSSFNVYVICESNLVQDDYNEGLFIGPIDMIKIAVTQGYNLNEEAHGILGN